MTPEPQSRPTLSLGGRDVVAIVGALVALTALAFGVGTMTGADLGRAKLALPKLGEQTRASAAPAPPKPVPAAPAAVEPDPGGADVAPAVAPSAVPAAADTPAATDAAPSAAAAPSAPAPSATDTTRKAAPKPRDKAAAAPAATGAFTVQLAAFPVRAEAEAHVARLARAGVADLRVVEAELGARGTWYRVQAGTFESRAEAADAAASLEARSHSDAPRVVPLTQETP